MMLGNFSIYLSPGKAKELGLTHRAMMWGVIPGYVVDGPTLGWSPVSDLLAPVEDLLNWLIVAWQEMRGQEPEFGLLVGAEIEATDG